MALRALQGPTGGGSPVGGTGTTNTIPRWTGPSTLGDSGLIDNGTAIYTTTRNFGIGTASPQARLHISGGTSGLRLSGDFSTTILPIMEFQSIRLDANDRDYQLLGSGSNVDELAFQAYLADRTTRTSYGYSFLTTSSSTPTLRLTGAGNVGIGTASPGAQLHVERAGGATANAEYIRLRNTTNATGSNVSLAFYTSNNAVSTGFISHTTATGPSYDTTFSNWNGSTAAEVMRIVGSTGNVGIGTASPVNHGAGAVTLAVNGTSLSMMDWMVNGTRTMACFAQAVISQFGTVTSSPLAFLTANTERARIDSAGNLILNSANTGATIQAAGTSQGLKLQGTGGTNNTDPNTLDCYADGGTANSGGVTWTPALRFGGATTGITGSQVGRYTRIGNMVFAQGTIALSSKGSATGAASIAGLPTSANVAATIYYSIAIGYNSKVTFTGQLHGLISVNSGIVELYQTSTAGVVSAITNTDFAADSVLTFTVCYPVT